MEERILEFIGDLRRAEIRISTAEALDALGASAEIGLTDRETFKATLASTLVKEARDEETFNRIFNLYFLDLEALGEGLKKALGPEDPKVQDQLDRLANEENLDLDELTELLMRGQGSEMEMAIRGRRPERRPRAADVLPAGRLLQPPHLRPVRLVGHRARHREDHAGAGGAGPRPRPARPHPQLSGAAAGGLPPHDPPARAARAGAPGLPGRARSSPARSWPTSRSSR